MKKITTLIISVLLFASIMCIVPASESDGAVTEAEDALIYEVYKIDISVVSVYSFYNVVNVVYFDKDDSTGKSEFEEALRNREPLPSGLDVIWDEYTTYDLTAYVFGPPVKMSGTYSNTYLYVYEPVDGGWTSNYKHILDKDRLDVGYSKTDIIGGQTVKVTILDAPDHVPLALRSSSYSVELDGSENQVEIEGRGDYAVYGLSWTSSPYASYTIEYEGSPEAFTTYGYAFLVVGVLFLGIMVWLARPQRIKN